MAMVYMNGKNHRQVYELDPRPGPGSYVFASKKRPAHNKAAFNSSNKRFGAAQKSLGPGQYQVASFPVTQKVR